VSHGGLPPRRPDQRDIATPRVPVPGARTTPIVNSPGTTVVVEDGGIPGALSVQGYAADGQTDVLVTGGNNPNGLKLWSAAISSWVGTTAVTGSNETDDQLVDGTGTIYLSLSNGSAAPSGGGSSTAAAVSQELHGIVVPAGRSLKLVSGSTGTSHRTSVTVVYTKL
jgi:hypothetical protein